MALRRILRGFFFAAAGLLLLLALLFGAIQTGPGKSLIANVAGTLASGNGLQVSITGIDGFVPSEMRIARIELADAKGVFARIDDLKLSWSPLALAGGTMSAGAIEAAKTGILRKPELPPAPRQSSGFDSMRILIKRLAIAEIDVAAPVFGHAMKLSLTASARLADPAEGLSLDFALDRRDLPGRAAGKVNYVPNGRVLDIDIAADEPEGGLIAGLARIEGQPPVSVTIKGKGPLDRFDATLAFRAGETAQAQGRAGILREQNGYALALDIEGEIGRLLPSNLAPLLEARTALDASLRIDDALRLTIDDLKLRAAGFGAALSGTFDTRSRDARFRFAITGGPAPRFARLAPGVTWQDWFVDGTLTGPVDRPDVKAAVTVQGPRASGYGARLLTFNAHASPRADGSFGLDSDGRAEGLEAADPLVAKTLGDTLDFALSGSLASDGQPALTAATIKLAPLIAEFSGRAGPDAAKGHVRLGRLDLAALSPLAGRPLAGQVAIDADIDVARVPAMVRMSIKGSSIGVSTGIAALDGFLRESTEVAGSITRGADGVIVVEGGRVTATNAAAAIDGRIDRDIADLKADLTLSDLALIDARVSGAANAAVSFSGNLDNLGLSLRAGVPSGRAMGQTIENLEITADAKDLTGNPSGRLTLAGKIAGKPATGLALFSTLPDKSHRLDPIDLSVGANRVSGALARAANGLIDGALSVEADNLADLSALALTAMAGKLKADLAFAAKDGKQGVTVKANGSNLRVAGQTLGKAFIDGAVQDALGTPGFSDTVELSDTVAGGVKIDRAKLVARGTPRDSTFDLDAVSQGAAIAAAGRIAASGNATALQLRSLSLSKNGTRATLASPSTLTISGSEVSIDKFTLSSGDGRAVVSGKAGPANLALDIALTALPLSLARLAGPYDDLRGRLDGTIKIAGTPRAPSGRYEIKIGGLSNPDIVRSGAGPFDIALKGDLRGGKTGLAMSIKGPSLEGVEITGSVPLGAGALELRARGQVALSVANAMLAASGNRLQGTASIDATVTGTLAAPSVSGTARIAGGRFDDVVNGVTIDKIGGEIVGSGRSLTLRNLAGQTRNGGRVSLAGKIAVEPALGFPGDLDVTFDNAGLVSSEVARLVAGGRLQASGPLLRRPKLTGRVAIRRLDITIPDRLSGGAKAIEVRHVNGKAPKSTKPAKPKARGRNTDTGGFLADLDLTLAAPNGIFVRGMGMDAELGGDLALSGTSAAPRSLGGFQIRRGQFNIFGHRLDFKEGRIVFNGSLEPELDFTAQTVSDGITAKVIITGPASQPNIAFASTPELPQDEVIARIMFNRAAGSLTIGQAAQLAQTVAQLSGSGPGAIDRVRRSLGVDSLDVGTDDTGTGGEVGIGKRINDKIYLGVKQGTKPNSSKVTIDIDITKNIRAQGATGADGSTEVGIGAEWDY